MRLCWAVAGAGVSAIDAAASIHALTERHRLVICLISSRTTEAPGSSRRIVPGRIALVGPVAPRRRAPTPPSLRLGAVSGTLRATRTIASPSETNDMDAPQHLRDDILALPFFARARSFEHETDTNTLHIVSQ
jgi:hypothetical protein